MAYVPVPKDLTQVKTKVLFNLTKRQLICFGGGALTGVPLFFILKGRIGTSAAVILMILAMLPCFFFALYEKNGQPFEKLLKHIIQSVFIRPKQRPYRTKNLYAVLEKQNKLNKEVTKIVYGESIEPRGKKANRGCNPKS